MDVFVWESGTTKAEVINKFKLFVWFSKKYVDVEEKKSEEGEEEKKVKNKQ